jgi:hypothetical protein
LAAVPLARKPMPLMLPPAATLPLEPRLATVTVDPRWVSVPP